MSAAVHSRMAITFVTRSALHPGSGDSRDASDAPITHDGLGKPILRASAIIGSIRHSLARPGLFSEGDLKKVLGGVEDLDGPSLVDVDDAPISDAVFERRQGVGIDRVTGAASSGIKYDVDVIARGAQFTIVLRAHTSSGSTLVDQFFATVADRARLGLLRFGARTTRGFGALQFVSMAYGEVDDRADFVVATKALARDIWPTNTALRAAPLKGSVPVMRFSVDLNIASSLFSKSALSSGMAIPETGRVVEHNADGELNHHSSLLLAGSSAKGVLRTQGEYQVRTLLGIDTIAGVDLNQQIDVCGIKDLFGWAADDSDDGHVAAISVDDCYGVKRVDQHLWTAVTHCALDTSGRDDSEDAASRIEGWKPIRLALNAAGLNSWRTMVHNRINEFTGGVVGTSLFSTLVPLHEAYEPLVVTVDLLGVPEAQRDALVGLLLSILRDVRRGAVGFGFGTSKGFGHLDPGSPVTVTLVDGELPTGSDLTGDFVRDPFGEGCGQWRRQLGAALSEWYAEQTEDVAA